MRRTLQIFLYLIVIALILIGAYYIYNQTQHKLPTHFSIPTVTVSTTTVKETQIPLRINGLGTVHPVDETQISPKQDGYIKAIYYQEGQQVKKGMLLIELSDEQILAQLQSDQQLMQTYQKEFMSYQAGIRQGLVSTDDYSRAKSDYETAVSNVIQDEIKLKNTKLYAPYSGQIGSNDLSVGDYVSAGQKLATIVDSSHIKIEYTIPSKYTNKVKLGQAVEINFHAMPHQLYPGKVTFVSPVISTSTGTIDIHALMKNPDFTTTPGESVNVIQIVGKQKALVIPETSIVANLQGYHVYTINAGKAQSVAIEQGDNDYGQVQITKGLKAGQTIITQGAQIVKDGQPVKVVN